MHVAAAAASFYSSDHCIYTYLPRVAAPEASWHVLNCTDAVVATAAHDE